MVNKLQNFNFRVNYPFNGGKNATKINKNASHSRFSGKNSIQVYLYSAFHHTNNCKVALFIFLRFYMIFRCRLLVVTMA